MPITASGIFSTAYFLKLLLANCAAVQTILEVEDAAAALEKISTYSDIDLELPRGLIVDRDITVERVDGSFIATDRQLEAVLDFYVPEDAGAETIDDEHSWVVTQLGNVTTQALTLAGTGESIVGSTHLNVHTMTLQDVYKVPNDERHDDSPLARWACLYLLTIM